jgi:hypothetical protein
MGFRIALHLATVITSDPRAQHINNNWSCGDAADVDFSVEGVFERVQRR